MSHPNKSTDKSKRYSVVKPNDFVNKTRTNERTRPAASTAGWTNLGKISGRRIPPPANVPSLKNELGTSSSSIDPIISSSGTSHGWPVNNTNQVSTSNTTSSTTPNKQPTQQQIDALPTNGSTPSTSTQNSSSNLNDFDKARATSTWSHVTAGSNHDQPPDLLGLKDFPRLATQDTPVNKSSTENPNSTNSSTTTNTISGPVFRPANLSSWKEGGGRIQAISSDTNKDSTDNNHSSSSISNQSPISTNLNNSILQTQPTAISTSSSTYTRPHSTQQHTSNQSRNYNVGHSYGSHGSNQSTSSRHQPHVSSFGNHSNQSHSGRGQNTEYKTPSILKNKDIDDLSKLTNNVTWTNVSQEVNYEEQIRFSDEEDGESIDNKKIRHHSSQIQSRSSTNQNRPLQTNYSQTSGRSRLIQDEDHLKQMQDNKKSEMITTLNVAKQRRDEQERNLRSKTYDDSSSQRNSSSRLFNENKSSRNYSVQPLMSKNVQENLVSSSQNESTTIGNDNSNSSNRNRQETNEIPTFVMKNWFDQMNSFDYVSLHEKSTAKIENIDRHDEPSTTKTNLNSSCPQKFSRSHSESSSQSQIEQEVSTSRSKHFQLTNRKQTKNDDVSNSQKPTNDMIDYFENKVQTQTANDVQDQWTEWETSNKTTMEFVSSDPRYQNSNNDSRRLPTNLPDESTQNSELNYENSRTKTTNKPRTANASRQVETTAKTTTTKSQSAWRALSPTRTNIVDDPTPQESVSYRTQTKTNENSSNSNNDRRQNSTNERKSRYSNLTTPINTASIPPLMSVQSTVPPATSAINSKHFKTTNNLHYSQRNDFYAENNDGSWPNEDEYYDDENGYYEGTMTNQSRHHSSMVYHSHSHHRGYTALGSYGRYRRGASTRNQQQYSAYGSSTGGSSQLNSSFSSKPKKTNGQRNSTTPKKDSEQTEPTNQTNLETAEEEPPKKPSAWSTEVQSKPTEQSSISNVPTTNIETEPIQEKPIVSSEVKSLLEIDTESTLLTGTTQNQSESSPVEAKKNSTIQTGQKKINQDQRHQPVRHRTTYQRSGQDYDSIGLTSHTYYGNNRRAARSHDASNSYYYNQSQQHYNNQYGYQQDPYHQTRVVSKTIKRGGSMKTSDRQPTKSATSTGSNSNYKTAHNRHHSGSDNEQKEGEEWETASESSTNMRNGHSENVQTNKTSTVENKNLNRDRTPPKKSFSNQRPLNSRHTENVSTYRRGNTLHERGSKTARNLTNRGSRFSTNVKTNLTQKTEPEPKALLPVKKEPVRHSLDGYDLNNVAGVVKIETLPAGALEEEGNGFDDGGDEFCLVMSKRDRKEQKAAQLSKQNAIEANQQNSTTNVDSSNKISTGNSNLNENEEQTSEKNSNEPLNQRSRSGKNSSARFNGKSTNPNVRQNKNEHQNASSFYYDQNNFYYYNQHQYYEQESYYNYGNYNSTHRQSSARRKVRQSQNAENFSNEQISTEKKIETNVPEKAAPLAANVMSHIEMWDPQTENALTNNSRKTIEKPSHDRKFNNEVGPSTSESSLSLPQRSSNEVTRNSPTSKPNENLARTIKPPTADVKSDRDEKKKSSNFTEGDNINALPERPLFEKAFLDYDDKQSIGAPADDYNQKINSLKMIWDSSEQPGAQLEQTINTMVAMQQQQQQDNTVSTNTNVKTDTYVKETITVSNTTISGQNSNMTTGTNDEPAKKTISSTVPPTTLNPATIYVPNSAPNKNEQKNVCTVKPTQQVPPNIQDQTDVNNYPSFPVPPIPTTLSQTQIPPPPPQQQMLPQAPMNPVHQSHSYSFYEGMLTAMAQQPQQPQQTFNRYPPHNFAYRNPSPYIQTQPSLQNTNPIYHHTSQGSMTGTPQTSALPLQPPMANYTTAFFVDPGSHMIGQPPAPPAPHHSPYMNNSLMTGRTQAGPYYRTPAQPQLPTPSGPGYGGQDTMQHSGYYSPFLQAPNANPQAVPHNMYGPNENFHPGPQPMFPRGGSIDRNDHSLMSQTYGRPGNYHSSSSNQGAQQTGQQGAPPPLLPPNLKSFPNNAQPNSASNQGQFYQTSVPPLSQVNQYSRQSMGIGQMANNNTRQPTQPPSLMGNYSKNIANNGQSFQQCQPLIHPQSNNNRPMYNHGAYSSYSKSTGPNDDNMKTKRI